MRPPRRWWGWCLRPDPQPGRGGTSRSWALRTHRIGSQSTRTEGRSQMHGSTPTGALGAMAALLQHSPRERSYDDLTDAEVEEIGRTLDALREDVLADRGARDAAYIRRVIAAQRCLEVAGRVVLLGSRSRTAWWLGTASLTLSKVLDNMEIGHNVLHGQWDWMRDPRIHSSTW